MLNLFDNNLFYFYNTDLTVDQMEENINKCANMSPINNLKSVEIQTETYYPNEEILRNKIKIL